MYWLATQRVLQQNKALSRLAVGAQYFDEQYLTPDTLLRISTSDGFSCITAPVSFSQRFVSRMAFAHLCSLSSAVE